MMFIEFTSKEEIIEYIILQEYVTPEEGALNIFASEITNSPKIMIEAQRYFILETKKFLFNTVIQSLDSLFDVPISIYKFSLLCGMRGPFSQKNFDEYILNNKGREKIETIARHPSFPAYLREVFYRQTGDVIYLPKDAQDIFVF